MRLRQLFSYEFSHLSREPHCGMNTHRCRVYPYAFLAGAGQTDEAIDESVHVAERGQRGARVGPGRFDHQEAPAVGRDRTVHRRVQSLISETVD